MQANRRGILIAAFSACSLLAGELSAQAAKGASLGEADYLGPPMVSPSESYKHNPTLRRCWLERLRFGRVRGEGTVSFVILASGEADTSSVQVVGAHNLSRASLVSLARRILPACEFSAAQSSAGHVPATVSALFTFGSRPSTSGTGGEPPAMTASAAIDDSGTVEYPIVIRCSIPWGTDQKTFRHVPNASVRLAYIIGTDGWVKADSTSVVTTSGSPEFDKAAVASIGSCLFVPARIDGEPTRFPITQEFAIRAQR